MAKKEEIIEITNETETEVTTYKRLTIKSQAKTSGF